MAVLAIAASITLPAITFFEDRARERRTEQALESALVAYYEDHGGYPSSISELQSSGYLPGHFEGGTFAADAWHTEFDFSTAGMAASAVSGGRDRLTSTVDDISRDISSIHVARAETQDEMMTIHLALVDYEFIRAAQSLPDLPGQWAGGSGAYQMLVDRELLPDDARFLTDSWGNTYDYDGTPNQCVDSPAVPSHLIDCMGAGHPDDDDSDSDDDDDDDGGDDDGDGDDDGGDDDDDGDDASDDD